MQHPLNLNDEKLLLLLLIEGNDYCDDFEIFQHRCVYSIWKQITTRYLTRKPKLEQNKQLKNIAACIWDHPEEDVKLALTVWQEENKKRLDEKNENWNYVHARTRKAYNSIIKKLPYCYTFEKHPELWIPKTNNSLESINWDLKTNLSIHR